nr:TonB-dependent receptor [Saprospiraceae bacterium]
IDRFDGRTSYWQTDKTEGQVAVSPKFGLVWQPILDKVSVFGNYMNGFVNVAPAQVADVDGSNPRLVTFDPEQANQYEFGVKANLLKDKIAATVSYYDITVKNRVMGDPENVNSSIQGGEVNSKGYEFSLVASPVSGLNLVAGYSHNDSEVTKDNPGDGYLGLRPEEAGPSDLVNFWASYTVQAGKLAGLGLGFGGNYASEYMTLNRATTGTFTLPSYTVLNAALSYTKSRYSLILKVDNLTDERYWTGWSTVTPQRLRSVSLSLSYKF